MLRHGRERVVVRVADGPHGAFHAGLGETVGVADREVLHATVTVVHELVAARTCMQRLLEREIAAGPKDHPAPTADSVMLPLL